MEYVYAAMILHETDREMTEENLTAVLDAANVDVEESRVRALVAALEDVDIDEAVAEGAAVPAAGAAAPAEDEAEPEEETEPEEEEPEDEEDEDEDAGAQGLGDLFG